MTRIVDFDARVIIAGAPKCGTTSLFDWLASLPNVCASNVKETRYFIDTGYPLEEASVNFHKGGADYDTYFSHCTGLNRIALDATPDYMYQKTALEQIPLLKPTPNVLFLLRRPSRRIFSLFQSAKYHAGVFDRSMTFDKFVKQLLNPDHRFNHGVLDDAIEHSRYVNWIEQWDEAMPSNRLHIHLFETMTADLASFRSRLGTDLRLKLGGQNDRNLAGRNVTARVRSNVLARTARRFGPRLARTKLGPIARRLYSTINLDTDDTRPSTKDLEVMKELDKQFDDSNARLARKYTLDLSSWG